MPRSPPSSFESVTATATATRRPPPQLPPPQLQRDSSPSSNQQERIRFQHHHQNDKGGNDDESDDSDSQQRDDDTSFTPQQSPQEMLRRYFYFVGVSEYGHVTAGYRFYTSKFVHESWVTNQDDDQFFGGNVTFNETADLSYLHQNTDTITFGNDASHVDRQRSIGNLHRRLSDEQQQEQEQEQRLTLKSKEKKKKKAKTTTDVKWYKNITKDDQIMVDTVFVTRTHKLWDDIERIESMIRHKQQHDDAVGGGERRETNIDDNSDDESAKNYSTIFDYVKGLQKHEHISKEQRLNRVHFEPGTERTLAVCCALLPEYTAYRKIIESAINLTPQEKQETFELSWAKCGVTSWIDLEEKCRTSIKLSI